MAKKVPAILPGKRKILKLMGENIRFARLRRKLSTEQVCSRAGISRPTLHSIEKGIESVSMGAYFQVMIVLGLEEDFLKIAQDDELGRKLQDASIPTRIRAPKKR